MLRFIGINVDRLDSKEIDKIADVIVDQLNKAQSDMPKEVRGCEHEFDSHFCPECGKSKFVTNPELKQYDTAGIFHDYMLPAYFDDWSLGINVTDIGYCGYEYRIFGVRINDIADYENKTIRHIKEVFSTNFKYVFDIDIDYKDVELH